MARCEVPVPRGHHAPSSWRSCRKVGRYEVDGVRCCGVHRRMLSRPKTWHRAFTERYIRWRQTFARVK